ncbi:MAG: formate dehydrogenase subunit gamma [Burkholderiaceae bacterium]|nr:formate dehydrogenase subunit gamma [Burkholderiaceae bacterium]
MTQGNEVQRYATNERINHWFTAICFVLLAASGLAFFHPTFWSLSAVLGGGETSRFLHPILGVLMFLSFFIFAIQKLGDNVMKSYDWQWMGRFGDVLANRDDNMPEIGKYNAAQKLMYWFTFLFMIMLLVSGVVIWRQFFSHMFTIDTLRLAALVHAVSGVLLIITIIVHIYAAIWVKGTMSAITKGTVTRAWAKHHHPLWYRSLENK